MHKHYDEDDTQTGVNLLIIHESNNDSDARSLKKSH